MSETKTSVRFWERANTSELKCRLTLPLPIVINFKFPLHPHEKFYITQYEEFGFHSLVRYKIKLFYYKFSQSHLYVSLEYCGEDALFDLGSERVQWSSPLRESLL